MKCAGIPELKLFCEDLCVRASTMDCAGALALFGWGGIIPAK